jgi:Gametolysin peptidase M11
MMHEMGHNLNFHHANVGTVEYGDRTGYMGGTVAALPSSLGRTQHLKAFVSEKENGRALNGS